jgi:hypothetical protein
MKIKDTEYGFSILPNCGKVEAEIYRISECGPAEFHIHLLSKRFGSMFRKPIETDYIKARVWADEQMRSIFNANKE